MNNHKSKAEKKIKELKELIQAMRSKIESGIAFSKECFSG